MKKFSGKPGNFPNRELPGFGGYGKVERVIATLPMGL
jgi:hypothetical protein